MDHNFLDMRLFSTGPKPLERCRRQLSNGFGPVENSLISRKLEAVFDETKTVGKSSSSAFKRFLSRRKRPHIGKVGAHPWQRQKMSVCFNGGLLHFLVVSSILVMPVPDARPPFLRTKKVVSNWKLKVQRLGRSEGPIAE